MKPKTRKHIGPPSDYLPKAMQDKKVEQPNGFSLIELSVVMFLISILMLAGLKMLNTRAESASYSATRQKQETIQDALTRYLGNYRRLPCPDAKTALTTPSGPDGNESRSKTAIPAGCDAVFGVVPYVALGLSRDVALDGWDNYFTYVVSPQWTLTFANSLPTLAGIAQTNDPAAAFIVGALGALTVNDRDPSGNVIPIATANSITGAVATIISHGKNGMGAVTIKGTPNDAGPSTSDEYVNSYAGTTFYKRDYTDTDVANHGPFDDFVLVLKPNDLISPLIKDGTFKSAMATIADQISTIKLTVIGAIRSPACSVPVSLSAMQFSTPTQITDPWGSTITYWANPSPLSAASPGNAGTVAFKIYSLGPNLADNSGPNNSTTFCPNSGDDVCVSMSNAALLALVGNLNCL